MESTSQSLPVEAASVEKGSSLWADAYIRLKKNKLAMLGGIIVILILFACFIVAPILSWMGYSGNDQDLSNRFAGFGNGGSLGDARKRARPPCPFPWAVSPGGA